MIRDRSRVLLILIVTATLYVVPAPRPRPDPSARSTDWAGTGTPDASAVQSAGEAENRPWVARATQPSESAGVPPSSAVASSPVTAGATSRPRSVKAPVAPSANSGVASHRLATTGASRPPRRPEGTQYAVRATFYCAPPRWTRCTRGYPASGYISGDQWIGYAAISPDLRTWTGRLILVTYGSKHVLVRVVDCNCQAEHSIDLYGSAFRRLAPLSAGVITVTLEPVG